MKVETIFLCDIKIRNNLGLKSQKVDKGDGTRHRTLKL